MCYLLTTSKQKLDQLEWIKSLKIASEEEKVEKKKSRVKNIMGAEIKMVLNTKKGKIIPKIVNNPVSFPSKLLRFRKYAHIHTHAGTHTIDR